MSTTAERCPPVRAHATRPSGRASLRPSSERSRSIGMLPYLVMEYVPGERVDHYCDGHRLTIEERLRLFLHIADAVAHAHENLVVHRDIEPSNILVTERSSGASSVALPKLLDFGIAKLLDPEKLSVTDVTREVMQLMTPAYASPEQLRGRSVTQASDLYSLGEVEQDDRVVDERSVRRVADVTDRDQVAAFVDLDVGDDPELSVRAEVGTDEEVIVGDQGCREVAVDDADRPDAAGGHHSNRAVDIALAVAADPADAADGRSGHAGHGPTFDELTAVAADQGMVGARTGVDVDVGDPASARVDVVLDDGVDHGAARRRVPGREDDGG
ncbi:MAG: protein kinase [bacterium]|nr:protein kinase [bacterium]